MADDNVKIKVGFDDKDVNKGVKNTKTKLKEFANEFKKTGNVNQSLQKMAGGFGIVTAAIVAGTKAIKGYFGYLSNGAKAYNIQLKGEVALQTAAKNNPYLNGESVARLKEFASEVQKVTTLGDEQILPYIGQLATAGRTQAQIMDIIKTAADVSASGLMSFDSAVSQLNASLNGNIGLMGRQIPGLKNLTAEELKCGKAIEIVKNQFSGMAEEVTSATGSYEQMKNAAGDFQEAVGKITKPGVDVWNNFWKKFYEDGVSALEKFNEKLMEIREKAPFGGDYRWSKEFIENINKDLKQVLPENTKLFLEDNAISLDNESIQHLVVYLESQKKRNANENVFLTILKEEQKLRTARETNRTIYNEQMDKWAGSSKSELNTRLEVLRNQKTLTKEETQERKVLHDLLKKIAEEEAEATQEEINQRAKLRQEYNDTVSAKKQELELRKKMGEEITQEQEDQELLQTMQEAWLKKVQTSHGLISGNYITETNELKEMEVIMNRLTEKFPELKSALSEVSIEEDKKLSDALKEQLEELDRLETEALKNGLDENTELYKEYVEKRKELAKQITEAEKAETLEQANAISESINNALDSLGSTIGKVSEMVTKNAENQALVETANIEKQYAQGILSAEEYAKAKERITKEQAEKEYKIQMWVWASQVAQATGSIAQSMLQVLSDSTISSTTGKIAMMSLAGALGAAQLSSIIGAKPIPPSFENGGVVGGFGGATDGHDNTYAHVRTGEMILNARNQQALWKTINGQNPGSKGVSLSVKNYASGVASVTPQITEDGITLLINKTVSGGLESGQFNKSLTYANARMKGTRYLN